MYMGCPNFMALGTILFKLSTCSIVGHTIAIFGSFTTVIMVGAQYTILQHILPGHRNWQELMGVFLVICGSMLTPMYDIIQL